MVERIVISSLDQLEEPARTCASEFPYKDSEKCADALARFFRSLARNPGVDALVCLKDEGTHTRRSRKQVNALRLVIAGEGSQHLSKCYFLLKSELRGHPRVVEEIVGGSNLDFQQRYWGSNPHLTPIVYLQFERNKNQP